MGGALMISFLVALAVLVIGYVISTVRYVKTNEL